MAVSPEDVESAYHQALESFTAAQREALAMLKRAYQFERMNNLTLNESLRRVFEEEARRRSGGDAGAEASP